MLRNSLEGVLRFYQTAFIAKEFSDRDSTSDLLMEAFGITPSLKAANRQYWGRELGMCWQRLCVALCRERCGERYADPVRVGGDEPYDFRVDDLAIDTKYRVGSGDAGTLKKFRANGLSLTEMGLTPTMLILRTDSLRSAMTACASGNWDVRVGESAFALLQELTAGFDLAGWLRGQEGKFLLVPDAAAFGSA